jgi:hypothetical protein
MTSQGRKYLFTSVTHDQSSQKKLYENFEVKKCITLFAFRVRLLYKVHFLEKQPFELKMSALKLWGHRLRFLSLRDLNEDLGYSNV